MSMSTMSRRDRTVIAVLGILLLYGIAVALFFMGRDAAWEKSRKNYERETKKYERQLKLIRDRKSWEERAEQASVKMPTAEDGEATETRWRRIIGALMDEHHVKNLGLQAKPEEEHGGVWEMPIEVRYEASLVRLVELLYAFNTVEDAMFDVRDIDITSKNTGYLSGKFTLTCAYMKGPSK